MRWRVQCLVVEPHANTQGREGREAMEVCKRGRMQAWKDVR